jgi:small subunit ribosomal protein S6
MTSPAPTYDLVLLLDPQAEEPVRAKLVADTRASISAKGELLRHDEWGERALSYPIERRTTARYHLLQFHAGDAELLSGLERTLRLADEVLRFRLIKLAPGVPSAPDMAAAPAPPGQSDVHDGNGAQSSVPEGAQQAPAQEPQQAPAQEPQQAPAEAAQEAPADEVAEQAQAPGAAEEPQAAAGLAAGESA